MNMQEIVKFAMCAIETGDMPMSQSCMISGVVRLACELAYESGLVSCKAQINRLTEQKDELLVTVGRVQTQLGHYQNALTESHKRESDAYLIIDRLQHGNGDDEPAEVPA